MLDYLIDTHCHLHDPEWFTPEQSRQFLKEAVQNNVQQIVVIGTSVADSAQAGEFAKNHDGVYFTYGVHPENLVDFDSTALNVKEIVRMPKLVAIGEVGLDYHYEGYNREGQIRLFEQMLQLAQDINLPVSLHIREAYADAWAVLDNFPEVRGVVHCFTGNKKELKEALRRGFYVAVNGMATYATPPLPPLEKMVLETDAPFLTPVPFRGTINKPGYVRAIAAYLAEKMGVAEETIAEQTTHNAKQLFQIGDDKISAQ